MSEETFIDELGFIVVGAALFAFLARRIGMPSIVAYLIAGLVLGPVTGLVSQSAALGLISEIGIALLLFLVGLELSFHKIKDVGKVAVMAGLGQVVFTAVGGALLCRALGFDWMEAVFLAAGLTFSSTVVVVKLLDEKGEMNSLHGRIAVGVLLFQDLVAIILLTLLAGLGRQEVGPLDGPAVMARLGVALGGMTLLLFVALLASRYVLPKPFAWSARSPEVLLIWSLSWCFLMVLGAHALHLSLEIGAFLAGISLAQLPYNEDLHRRLHPLMNFCIAVFFVLLGVRMDIGPAIAQWPVVLALSLGALVVKPLLFLTLLPRQGCSGKVAFKTGTTLAQISEFSFIVLALGVNAGLIGPQILSITALVGLITITVSSYLIRFDQSLYEGFLRAGALRPFLPRKLRAPHEDGDDSSAGAHGLENHVIVVGMNSLGRRLASALAEQGTLVVAVDTDPHKLLGLPCRTELGNASHKSVLDHLNLRRARLLVSTLHIDSTNDLLAYRCREAGVPCAVHVHDVREMENLLAIGTDYLMISKVDGVKKLNAKLRELGCLPSKNS